MTIISISMPPMLYKFLLRLWLHWLNRFCFNYCVYFLYRVTKRNRHVITWPMHIHLCLSNIFVSPLLFELFLKQNPISFSQLQDDSHVSEFPKEFITFWWIINFVTMYLFFDVKERFFLLLFKKFTLYDFCFNYIEMLFIYILFTYDGLSELIFNWRARPHQIFYSTD